MMSRRWILVAMSLTVGMIIAACGAGPEPTEEQLPVQATEPEPEGVIVSASVGGEVASEDGNVVVEIPAGALAADTDITVERLEPADYPSELDGIPVLGDVYSFGPDGLEFAEPVRIIRRFPLNPHGDRSAPGLPWAIQLSRDADGEWFILEDTEVSLDGDEFVVAASTRHFSPNLSATTVEFYGTEARFSLFPPSAEKEVGLVFFVSVQIDAPSIDAFRIEGIENTQWSVSNPEVLSVQPNEDLAQFECEEVGTSDFHVDLDLSYVFNDLPTLVLQKMAGLGATAPIRTRLTGKATCVERVGQATVEYFRGAESRRRLLFGDTDGVCGFPNFADTYRTRFDLIDGEPYIELLQLSSGQLVQANLELPEFSFDEASNALERYEDGHVTLDPETGMIIFAADYFHPCPGGTGEQHWLVTGPFFPDLFTPLQPPVGEVLTPSPTVPPPTAEPEPTATVPTATPEADDTAPGTAAACQSGPNTLCLGGDRFQLDADWFSAEGTLDNGEAIPIDPYTGSFAFVEGEVSEFAVKMLNGCPVNGHFWVFIGEPSSVNYRLDVVDTRTGEAQVYLNVPGEPARPILDTQAFATCP